jgi:hypothetical protein
VNLSQRLFGLLIAVVSAGMLYYVWTKAQTENVYYPKLAVFMPIGVVIGVFLMILPQYSGKPETTHDKIVVFSVFAIGIIAGLIDWYLVDPGFFGF